MTITTTVPTDDYALLDSGDSEKLERYGKFIISRPDPQALWPKKLSDVEWKKSDAVFIQSSKGGSWQTHQKLPDRWECKFDGLKFWIKLTSFKHIGIFPENQPSWQWMRDKISSAKRPIKVLNLFGYTGGASLACAQAGANVCHIDASKVSVNWAKENAELSHLKEKPIRWIVEDARVFVKRELTRGNRYDAILLDPPAFGHGPTHSLWRIETDLISLLENCQKLLSPQPLFFLIHGYASGYSSIAYANNLKALFGHKGNLEIGECTIGHIKDDRLLPCGIFARWSAI